MDDGCLKELYESVEEQIDGYILLHILRESGGYKSMSGKTGKFFI